MSCSPMSRPLGWQHINLTGDYLWAAEPQIGPDGFRPGCGEHTPSRRMSQVRPSVLLSVLFCRFYVLTP